MFLTENVMKKSIFFISLTVFALQLAADAYKDELKSIASDRSMIVKMEKSASKDEKGCGKTDETLTAAVQMEVNIYCQARARVMARLPQLRKMIDDYEPALKNFFDNCPEVTDDDKLKLCQTLHEKVLEKAAAVNKEKEELAKDLDLMENAGKKAAETLKHDSDIQQKEHGEYLKDALRLKKETVITMNRGLTEDVTILNRSKTVLTKNISRGSKELQSRTASLLKGVTSLISMNNELQVVCSAMLRCIDAANSACNLKYSEKGCADAEKNLETKFNDGNARIKAYTQEKQRLASEEETLNRQAVTEASFTMDNAKNQITGYLKNIEMQNDMLKQRVELSTKDAEVIRGMADKTLIKTYTGYVETMISLKVETDGFIKKFNDFITRMDKFKAECIDSKTDLSAVCGETGNILIKEVDSTMDKVTKYGAKFNRLNSDLAAFSKKVSGK